MIRLWKSACNKCGNSSFACKLYTLARINPDGSTMLLEYPKNGTTWIKDFKNGVELDEGDYALVTGMRLANGGVLSEMQMFRVKHTETIVVGMYLRTSETEVTVKGNFDSESKFTLLDGKEVSLLSQTGRGYFVTGIIGVGQEPTNHALKDIAKVSEVFEKWNRPIILLFEDEAAANKFRLSDFEGLPSYHLWNRFQRFSAQANSRKHEASQSFSASSIYNL